MSIINGTVRKGRIETEYPINFPDGTNLTIAISNKDTPLDCEANWQDTPEAIDAWLKWFDSLEPLTLSEKEKAQIEIERHKRKEFEKEHFFEHSDREEIVEMKRFLLDSGSMSDFLYQ